MAGMETAAAIRYFGTKSELARALGIARQAVNGWGPVVPRGRQLDLEQLTGGKLKAARIRLQAIRPAPVRNGGKP